ncbi:hypothetical protein GCM10027290_65040 [Micromonospora sonneratiae]|uniref:Uncharacterized protein n=1 Tax=Micromonospora sonneratiae TaxID=1184706 RepID=A0ABW3YL65_9ACTN
MDRVEVANAAKRLREEINSQRGWLARSTPIVRDLDQMNARCLTLFEVLDELADHDTKAGNLQFFRRVTQLARSRPTITPSSLVRSRSYSR